jgi:hypothetical protein
LPGLIHHGQHDLQPKAGPREDDWRRTLYCRTLDRSMGGSGIACRYRRIAL